MSRDNGLIIVGGGAIVAFLLLKSGAEFFQLDIHTFLITASLFLALGGAWWMSSNIGILELTLPFLPAGVVVSLVPACNYWAGKSEPFFVESLIPWYGDPVWQLGIIAVCVALGIFIIWRRRQY